VPSGVTETTGIGLRGLDVGTGNKTGMNVEGKGICGEKVETESLGQQEAGN
jgi:hypothetical protein